MDGLILREREAQLVEQFGAVVPWLEPQTTTVGNVQRFTCRLCTAIDGLRANDVLNGTVGFDSEEEHAQHLREVHVAGEGKR